MSRASRPLEVHQYLFPMYLVSVQDFLDMEGVPMAHQELSERGLLHEWQHGMYVIFVSHQWLGRRCPDPLGQQLSVLRRALRRLIDGSLKVEADMTRMDKGRVATSYGRLESHHNIRFGGFYRFGAISKGFFASVGAISAPVEGLFLPFSLKNEP